MSVDWLDKLKQLVREMNWMGIDDGGCGSGFDSSAMEEELYKLEGKEFGVPNW